MRVIIDEVEYREIPACDGYLAGMDGTIWKGNVWTPKGEWRQLVGKPQRKGRTLWVTVHEAGFVMNLRVGELVLRAFGKRKNREKRFLGYHDKNPANTAFDNLYWTTRYPRESKKKVPTSLLEKYLPRYKERRHASQDNGTTNPPHHLPDR